MQVCDDLRDNDLIDCGIRLEDKAIGEPASWKIESKERLIKEREERQ